MREGEAVRDAMDDDSTLTDEFFLQAQKSLRKRLDPKRFDHCVSTAETAVELAQIYGVDERKARIAGLLHDWDKEYDDKGIQTRVQQLGIDVDPEVYAKMPRLLHGLTASEALKREMPGLGTDVLDAISKHTSGAVGMTDLAMVVYIADSIEPQRPYRTEDRIWEAIGKAGLEDLFFMTYRQVFARLVQQGHRMHPDTVRIWNYYTSRERARRKEEANQ